jgi:hypothetical protein
MGKGPFAPGRLGCCFLARPVAAPPLPPRACAATEQVAALEHALQEQSARVEALRRDLAARDAALAELRAGDGAAPLCGQQQQEQQQQQQQQRDGMAAQQLEWRVERLGPERGEWLGEGHAAPQAAAADAPPQPAASGDGEELPLIRDLLMRAREVDQLSAALGETHAELAAARRVRGR